MRRLILAAGIVTACAAALAQTTAQERLKAIQADPAALKTAIEGGRKASSFCVNCHGDDGISKTPEVPNLGGQNPAYLLEQIRKFGNGERVNPFMQGVIKVLKDEERMQHRLVLRQLQGPAREGRCLRRWRAARNCSPSCASAAMANRRVATRRSAPRRPADALPADDDHALPRQYRRAQQPVDVDRHGYTEERRHQGDRQLPDAVALSCGPAIRACRPAKLTDVMVSDAGLAVSFRFGENALGGTMKAIFGLLLALVLGISGGDALAQITDLNVGDQQGGPSAHALAANGQGLFPDRPAGRG